MDTLRQGLLTFFSEIGIPIDQDLEQFILTATPENTSSHQPYQEYYTPELENLVREREAFLIEKFGFQFA